MTGKIIAAAIDVHKKRGPGFVESVYENALVYDLERRGLKVDQLVPVKVYYEDLLVGKLRLDLVVEDTMVVELKAIRQILDLHFAIARSCLRATNRRYGLRLNFAQTTLEIKRVIA